MSTHEATSTDPTYYGMARAIREGTVPASTAIGHPGCFPHLTTGATGNALALLGSSAKIAAGASVDVLGTVLYMMPAGASGRQSCAYRTSGCEAACLAEGTGRMSMTGSQTARRRRHGAFYADRGAFLAMLHEEIAKHERSAIRQGKVPAVRLNGTTDLPWHRMPYVAPDGTRYARIHDAFPAVSFYEYTKVPLRIAAKGGLPANLHLTFSMNERAEDDAHAADYLASGYGAAVVIMAAKHEHPPTFNIGDVSYPMVDGDAHDARFLDPASSIVALAAKGRAKSDTSGFVRTV